MTVLLERLGEQLLSLVVLLERLGEQRGWDVSETH
jgi:hypothetical protein